VCARDLLLMQGFLLGALLVYARMRASGDSLGGWAATLGLLALSILGKTNAAVAPALVLAFELLFGAGARARGTWLRPLVAAAVPVLFVAWTSFGLGFSDLDQLDPEDANPWLYGLTELRAHLFHYARNAVWPFRMRLLPDVGLVDGASDPGVWLGLAFVLASLAVAWRLRERAPAASFAILAYWILFALTSSVIPLRQKVADYRQYPSLAFLGLLAGWWIWRALPERAARAALAALTLYFGASTFALSRSWSDGESLWSRSVRYGGTAQAHLNYGRSVVDRDPVLAESHYREALRRDPDNVFALTNLGILLVHTGHTDAGLAELFAAVDLRPRDAQMRHWYAEGLARAGRAGDALAQRVLAAAFDPRQPDYADRADRARAAADGRALYDAARALQLGGETALSLPLLERLHRTGPGHADSLFLEGWARQSAGERAAAIELYERQLAEQPDHVQARLNLALARLESGEPEAARAHFERVLELDPTRGEAHFHLARCLELLGDTEGAARERALWAAGR
jgi:tetratricopeptide (TPR) repeat protein